MQGARWRPSFRQLGHSAPLGQRVGQHKGRQIMIGIIATLQIQDGKAEAFEAVFRELSAAVRAGEPGNLCYQLTRSKADPLTYKVLELYADEDALNAHGASAHFKAAGPGLGACLAGRPDIERLDGVS
jgi:quinol monooxygenase YgiN